MEIEQVNIIDIVPYENNPRKNDKAVNIVMKSIKEFGFLVPVILDDKNTIVAGHTRVKAAIKLGMDTVPVIYTEGLNEEQIKAFRIMDNKSQLYAEWDFDKLKDEFYALEDTDWFNSTGFTTQEISEIWDEDVKEDDFDTDKSLEEPKYDIKNGDIYQLGTHRLVCGDATKKEDVDRLMNGEKADMVFTDPPYGMNLDTDWSNAKSKLKFYKEKGCKGQGGKYDKVIGDNEDYDPSFLLNYFDCKEIFLWGADYYKEYIPKIGSWFVWDKRSNDETEKNKVKQSDKMYGSCFELCWSKEKHRREIARVKWAGIFGTETEPDEDKSRVHPTQKPVKLAEWFINKFSKENQLIVDVYAGSGFTLLACEQLKRKCYMMELDERYCSVIIERWEKLTGKEAEKINGN